jgi:hypothetical protein
MRARESGLMESDFGGHVLSLPVKDIYGRNMGEIVGAIYDLEGKIESIGVSESAGRFTVYPANRLVKGDSEILVVPGWRVEAQNLARQKDALARRERAIEELADSHDLDPRIFDEVTMQIDAARQSHGKLREKVAERLKELEARYKAVTDIVEITKVQHVTTEIDEWAYSVTVDFGRVQLETDGRELAELRSAMGFLENVEQVDPIPSAGPLPQPQENFAPVMFDLVTDASAKTLVTEVPAL